jgi:hypothetical protein
MRKIYLLIGLAGLLPLFTNAQVSITTTGNYTQNFNSLPSTGSATWTDNSTIANWYAQRSAAGTTIVANDGSSNSGALYSYGTGTNADRALGTLGSGTPGNFAYGVQLQNNSGVTVTDLQVAFTGEQWRNSAAAAQTANFYYKISSTPITALNPNANGTWTAVTALNFTSPITGGTASALDGNAAANRTVVASFAIPSLSLAAGQYIMLKWDDIDHTGADHGLSIDDVTISWTVTIGGTPTKLAITNVNPASPTVNAPFSVTVQSQDAGNAPTNVTGNTTVNLSLVTGTGALGGTLTGVIPSGANSVTITGNTYNVAENNVTIQAADAAAVLTAGTATFNVLAAASQLALVGVPATGLTATNLSTFTVEARRPDNSVDNTYTSNITISKVSGPGNVTGTVTVAAVAGVATFSAVQMDASGTYTIHASDGTLTSPASGNIVISDPASFTEVLLPQYIQGLNTTNNNRVPYVYRATLGNLLPNTTYRYTNLAANAADLATPTAGAGNQIFYNGAGNFTRNTAGTSLSTAGAYSTFTTDGSGSYTGWFIVEPTANAARFTPGTALYMRILLNDGAGGTSIVTSLVSSNTATVVNFGATAADGSGIMGASHAPQRDLVFLYDNVTATGRPVASTFVESDGTSGGTAYPAFYQSAVDAQNSFWGTIIPNTLPNGIRRIQFMNSAGANVYGVTSTDGVWAGAVNTVNPTAGITALSISRTATGTGGDFIVDNSLSLASAVTVNGTLVLNNGIVTATAANLLLLPAGASVSGASNSSFVDGPVSKTGNTNFTFPVGKTGFGYVPVGISNFTASTPADAFTAEYIRGNARNLGPVSAIGLDHVSGCDYWLLDLSNGTPTVDVTLNWSTNNVCNGAYVTDLPSLTVAHFNGTTWDSYGGEGTASGTVTAGSITRPGVSAFSPFSLGGITFANPLPISISWFKGVKQNGAHSLNWKVNCNSTPSVTLTLERSSAANGGFAAVYSIQASATRCNQPFDHTDAQPLPGMNYYRLKMVDANGKISYSGIVALLNSDKGFEVTGIAPNPVTDGQLKFNVSAAKAGTMDMVITDMQGRLISRSIISLAAGFNTILVDASKLASGTYYIYGATGDGKSKPVRFVKQ